jgi:hypothetical protein
VQPHVSGVSHASTSPEAGTEPSTPRRPASWSLDVGDDVYRGVAAWTSGAAWFDAVMDDLSSAEGDAARRAARISVSSYLAVAKADRDAADYATGRSLSTSNARCAATARVGERTAERARALLAARGFAVTVAPGRYLTNDERAAARAAHGRTQIRAASVRALTLPRGSQRPVESGDLPASRRDAGSTHVPNVVNATQPMHLTYVDKTKTTRAVARETAAPRPQPRMKKQSTRSRQPWPLATQQLAAQLVDALPRLRVYKGQARHIGAVCGLLARIGVDASDWTGEGLKAAVDAYSAAHGIVPAELGRQRSPLAYYAWLLRATLDEQPEPNRRRHERAAAETRARLARQAAERAEEQQQRERIAQEADAIASVIEQMRRDYPSTPQRRRRVLV